MSHPNEHEHTHCQHNHADHGSQLHIHPVVKNMRVALLLNLSFTVIECIGGLWTNSVAILSDAIHDLGDSIAIGASLIMEKQASKGRTPKFTYGKRRWSTLAALITSLILVLGSVFILKEAIPRFWSIQEVKAGGMFWLAIGGIAFNGLALLRLRASKSQSLNQRAVMLHMMEDTLGWIAVLVGAAIMWFTQWYWLDPLLSVGIALFILYNASKNIWATLNIFLQAAPSSFNESIIIQQLKNLPYVSNIHALQCWTLDGEQHVLTLHVDLSNPVETSTLVMIRQQIMEVLQTFNIGHTTLQLETENEVCMMR